MQFGTKTSQFIDEELNFNYNCKCSLIPILKKNNLNENFVFEHTDNEMTKLGNIFREFKCENKDILFFVNDDKNIFEFIRRKDLNIEILSNLKNLDSISSYNNLLTDFLEMKEEFKNNILSEEHLDSFASLNDSDIDISKNTEFNTVSNVIKETVNLISEI